MRPAVSWHKEDPQPPEAHMNADNVYRERAALVAHLAAVYPSVMAYNDPQEPDWPVVYVDTPQGQLSWHLAPGDLDLFGHVGTSTVPGEIKWDGHDTPEKYRRLAALTAGTYDQAWRHHDGRLNDGAWHDDAMCIGCRFSVEHAKDVEAHYRLVPIPPQPGLDG